VDLFAELSEAAVKELRRLGFTRRYTDKQLVQQRGDLADYALIVLSGRLMSSAHLPDGTESLTRWMEVGEMSGLSSILSDIPVPVTLMAKGPTEILFIPGPALIAFLTRDGEACVTLLRMLGLRVNEMFDMIFCRASQRLSDRVWVTVQRLACENGESTSDGPIILSMSQTEIARVVGASRQRVNDELLKLQKSKKIRLGYRRLEVLSVGQ
tara:strand:- start:284 stop:916 length:633 start_codon:yes stop_codon:yes gene_type:complete